MRRTRCQVLAVLHASGPAARPALSSLEDAASGLRPERHKAARMGAMAEAPAPPSRCLVVALLGAWISTSALCVMLNKHILFYLGFKFPTTLAVMHMLSASAVASSVVHLSPDGRQHVPPPDKMRGYFHFSLALIATLYGFVLVLSNSAFMYLSVPTIQMLKVRGAPRGCRPRAEG